MSDEILQRDQNRVTVLAGITDDADQDITMLRVDSITKRLLIAADLSGVVTSINNLTGAVTLAAGSNITITPSGNTLTIASTASGGGTWGSITGTLSNQTDLQSALDAKVSGTGTAGRVAIWDATTNITSDADLTFDGTTLSVGIADVMTVNGGVITSMVQINSDTLGIQEVHTHSSTPNNGAFIYHARSRGTTASPSVVSSGDLLGGIAFVGHDGTDYATSAAMYVFVDGTPGSNDMPGKFVWYTSPDGSQTLTERMSLSNSGLLSFTADSSVDMSSSTTLKIPVSATPTITANGHLAVDTTVTDFSHGILKYYGGEELGVVAMPIAQFTSPTNGRVVAYNSTNDEFELIASGTGDFVGPASSTDNAVVRFDGTTGKLGQNSVVTISDVGVMDGVLAITTDTVVLNKHLRLGKFNNATSGANVDLGATNNPMQRLTSATLTSIDMATAGFSGQMLWLYNVTGGTVTINHDTGATAIKRFYCPGGVGYSLLNNSAVSAFYSGDELRWVIISG